MYLFCRIPRSLQGVIIRSLNMIGDATAKTTTSSGLRVVVQYAENIYQTGIKASQYFVANDSTFRDEILPRYNFDLLSRCRLDGLL